MPPKKKTLTLHIGAHKTATTVLQNHVFPSFPGYQGKYEPGIFGTKNAPTAEKINHERLWLEVYRHWLIGSPKLSKVVRRWIDCLLAENESSILVSSEEFHSWPSKGNPVGLFLSDGWFEQSKETPHPFISLLETIKRESQGSFDLRVILAVRNQVDYIGSRYAQTSINLHKPSQVDFEMRVSLLLNDDDHYLDWSRQIEDLREFVGRENVLVLVYEDGLEDNVFRIQEFLDMDSSGSPDAQLPRENVKSLGTRRWVLLEKRIPRVGIYGAAFWYFFTRLSYRGIIRKASRLAIALFEGQARINSEAEGAVKCIEISEDLAAKIRSKYRVSNERLEGLLGRDLSKWR